MTISPRPTVHGTRYTVHGSADQSLGLCHGFVEACGRSLGSRDNYATCLGFGNNLIDVEATGKQGC